MNRISTNMVNDSMQFYMRDRSLRMNELMDQAASQSRIRNLRDDPASAAHATRHQSVTGRLERYSENLETAQSRHRVAEGQLMSAVDMVQRIRELTVQAATGTYTAHDRAAIATEIDQLLEEMVLVANGRDGDGSSIFAGTRSNEVPFRVVRGGAADSGSDAITGVVYRGNDQVRRIEIADGETVAASIPGNTAFWAEAGRIYSGTDGTGYTALQDATITVNGTEIAVSAGDNIYGISAKVNDAGAGVKARVDPVTGGLVLEGETAREITLTETGTVLQDLGVLAGPDGRIAATARSYGGSVFDAIISVRDMIREDQTERLGGQGLRQMDQALDAIIGTLATVGARSERIEVAYRRTAVQIENGYGRISHELDVDLAETVTDLSVMEYTHRAALSTASKIMQTTLLDFLR